MEAPMSQSPLKDVLVHWHKLVENLQTSSLGFYSSLEEALKRRKVHGLETSRIEWNEGGVLAPQREYLRITGERHSFDICAAPFGTGFFFSSWMTKTKARFVFLYLTFFFVASLVIWKLFEWMFRAMWEASPALVGVLLRFSVGSPFVLIPLSFLIVIWLIAVLARAGHYGPEAAILTVPIIGWLYAQAFVPETYYRVDTMLMFQSAVHAALLETINGLLTEKGLRQLGESEGKPIFHELVMKQGNRNSPQPLTAAAMAGVAE
jgi:hypothetical protein